MTNLSCLLKVKLAAVAAIIMCVAAYLISSIFIVGVLFALVVVVVFVQKTEKELSRVVDVCKRLSKGDFEARMINITEKGLIEDLQWSINEVVDYTDAYVRESAAAMEYVSRNQYFRNILEGGMQGSLLNATRVINSATEGVGAKMGSIIDVANDFDTSLNEVVVNINETVATLSTNADEMGTVVESTQVGTSSAVSTTDEMSSNVQAISAAAEEMSSSIAEISQQITRTADIAGGAVTEVDHSCKLIEALAISADQIGDVVAMIQDIAEQTNLLALNATIEAARAGDAGKGFAVVASEVKALAGQTAAATDDISKQVADIQNATKKAVDSFSIINKTIGEINEAAAAVASAVEEQSAASREIASNAEKASMGTSDVLSNVREISGNMDRVDEVSKIVIEATGTLSEQATKRVGVLIDKMAILITDLKRTT